MAILFSDLCLLFEKITHVSKAHLAGNAKGKHKEVPSPRDIFKTWLSALRDPSHSDGLLIFRLLFPEHDIRRRYGLKETLLAREIPAALGFVAPSYLTYWSGLQSHRDVDDANVKYGCFGLCLRDALRHRVANSQRANSLTIAQVDTLLDELASHCDFSSNDVKHRQQQRGKALRPRRAILHDLFSSISPSEAAYLSQIILRDLSPMLYPIPSLNSEEALLHFNASSWRTLDLTPALEIWHWALPTVFRYRADLDASFAVLSNSSTPSRPPESITQRQTILQDLARPAPGHRIEIPSAIKGRNCGVVAEAVRGAGIAYAEVKYDGERMQIHVNLNSNPCITIFSKSKRDSTGDRARIHPIIMGALGLPSDLSGVGPSPHYLARLKEATLCNRLIREAPVQSVILEAEMVAYNEDMDEIDEFANLTHCVENSDKADQGQILDSSQTNSDGSSDCQRMRHLAAVFFDILWLNGRSLIMEPYKVRRAILEATLLPVQGYSMLAARTPLDFRSVDSATAQRQLIRVFAKCIVNRNEGLMIKTEDSIYNDDRKSHKWTKLKRDYIPGLGDSITCCIVAASWTKDRARELHVPTDCFTTFYVGALRNDLELQNGVADKPCYEVLFRVSYLANRSMLLRANRLTSLYGGVDRTAWTGRIEKTWSFDLTIPADLRSEIAFVLARPLVFELYGAGFTRRKGSSLYELRFPRVSAIHESRKPSEAVTLSELQKLAKESSSWIGSEAESEVDDMWSRHSSGSGGETSGGSANDWRSRQENHWIKKLTRACQPRARRLKPQRGEQGRTFTSQTTPNSAPEVQNAMSSEKARLLSDKSNGFDEEQPYLWTCLPFHLASQIHLPVAYRVASVQSLFFTVSSLRKASAPVQAVILLEEPLTLEGKTWLRELVDCFRAEGADIGGTSQVWIQPLPRVCNDSGYNVESLNVETMRKLEPLD